MFNLVHHATGNIRKGGKEKMRSPSVDLSLRHEKHTSISLGIKIKAGHTNERYPWSKLSTETKCKTGFRFRPSDSLARMHETWKRIVEVSSFYVLLVVCFFRLLFLRSFSFSTFYYWCTWSEISKRHYKRILKYR